MKKIYFFVALLLTAIGSWAFYPKAAAPSGYMMVVSRIFPKNLSFGKANYSITVINPDGQIQTQEVDASVGTLNKIIETYDQRHASELKKLHELQLAGWRLISSTQTSGGPDAINETTFLLEKQ